MSSKDALGDDGFVFLDDRPWLFMVSRVQLGEWWLYYWSQGSKSFVKMRKLFAEEVELRFRPLAITHENAALYFRD
jgi:hypothetical protein